MAANNGKKIIQTIILLLMLAGLPLGSWFYLQRGLDYRLSALEELKDYGEVPPFELATAADRLLTRNDLQGRMVISGFLTTGDAELRTAFGEVFSKLFVQFDERDDVALLVFGLDGVTDTPAAMERFAADYGLTDEKQCYLLPGGQPGMEQLVLEGYQLPLPAGTGLPANPYLALADTSLTIRHYYDVTDPGEVKSLVEHIALILPRAPERDIVFKREPEK